jgi:hypothetical protein
VLAVGYLADSRLGEADSTTDLGLAGAGVMAHESEKIFEATRLNGTVDIGVSPKLGWDAEGLVTAVDHRRPFPVLW